MLALAAMQVEAKQALVQLGFKATEARAAIDRAEPHDSLEALVREALQRVR
jgi:Holliday junction resolvasome RuvABC DNA-binding subunit